MGFMILTLLYKSILKWKNEKERGKSTVGVGKLIDFGLAMVLKNNRHGFFFPPEPLLPGDERLNNPAKLLIAQVIF